MEISKGSTIMLSEQQLSFLKRTARGKPEIMIRKLMDCLFDVQTLAEGCAIGARSAHNKLGVKKSSQLDEVKICAIKGNPSLTAKVIKWIQGFTKGSSLSLWGRSLNLRAPKAWTPDGSGVHPRKIFKVNMQFPGNQDKYVCKETFFTCQEGSKPWWEWGWGLRVLPMELKEAYFSLAKK